MMVSDGGIVAAPGGQLLLQLGLCQSVVTQLLKLVAGNLGQDHGFLGLELSRVPVTKGGTFSPEIGWEPPPTRRS